MKLHKIFRIVAAILSLVGAIFLVLIISKGDKAIDAAYLSGGNTSIVDNMSFVAYTIFGLTLLFVIIFVVKNLFTDTGSLKSTLIGLGAFATVIVVAYLFSGGDATEYFDQGVKITEGTSHMVGAGLVTFYILGASAIGSILFTGVKKLIK
ncbi:MAG: hypothetical protein DRI75_01640 [Bacteroidetes bacterium]|nr:MAG: hypothetical protein DRI75_01640 [Bacteroidota bacterium]